ncbi:uncharacterized protein LOC127731163 isoform X1 [Mytilus californianus]|uniref:uncharacterized protein LOC127731163 isoform X1 n=1 Tax=Mytilus californianus TaxID=6549 RepID=UPI002247821A|nr:uncharacterized protein LOC127731163 isoform X1 [Mytilus californianus]
MGCSASKTYRGGNSLRIVMVGLDGSGKTTLMYRLVTGEVIEATPTLGFNVETITYKDNEFTIWDMGGQENIRRLWRHYFLRIRGILFVIDSADKDRIDEAQQLLDELLQNDELLGTPIVVVANKQDLDGAMKEKDIVELLELKQISGRLCTIQGTSAITGAGIHKALDNILRFRHHMESVRG